jgi:hypothetical protein
MIAARTRIDISSPYYLSRSDGGGRYYDRNGCPASRLYRGELDRER